jgi:hypothetical protein
MATEGDDMINPNLGLVDHPQTPPKTTPKHFPTSRTCRLLSAGTESRKSAAAESRKSAAGKARKGAAAVSRESVAVESRKSAAAASQRSAALDAFEKEQAAAAAAAAVEGNVRFTLTLTVMDWQGKMSYTIKESTPLKSMMVALCRCCSLQISQICFTVATVEGGGMPIAPDDTSVEWGFLNGDIAVVFQVPPGGMSAT